MSLAVVSGVDANNTAVTHFLPCPDLYCCEGKPSPGNPWPCDSISPCARNRTGPLCGHCAPGFTEVFGSPVCIPKRECSFSQVGCPCCVSSLCTRRHAIAQATLAHMVSPMHTILLGREEEWEEGYMDAWLGQGGG